MDNLDNQPQSHHRNQWRSPSQARFGVRRWGPFSGGQLTTMIVASIIALALPGGAWAVDTFTNVAVQDPSTGVKAAVTGDGRLKVDPQAQGNEVHQLFSFYFYTGEQILSPSSPWYLNWRISSITISNGGLSRAVIDIDMRATNCVGGTTRTIDHLGRFTVDANTTSQMVFPTPLFIPSQSACNQLFPVVRNVVANGGQVDVLLSGTVTQF